VNSEVSDHDESIVEEVEALHDEMSSIHSDLSPTAEHRDVEKKHCCGFL
jgi:hypothetical protein